MSSIRPCREDEHAAILAIVNAAAEAYRGAIPADRWHEPYMDARELEGEIASGIAFWGYEDDGALIGVMGIQPVGDVDLIRHAYVFPGNQGRGVGRQLLEHLRGLWSGACSSAPGRPPSGRSASIAATASSRSRRERKSELLKTYWSIPERQIETSVVLAHPPLDDQARA